MNLFNKAYSGLHTGDTYDTHTHTLDYCILLHVQKVCAAFSNFFCCTSSGRTGRTQVGHLQKEHVRLQIPLVFFVWESVVAKSLLISSPSRGNYPYFYQTRNFIHTMVPIRYKYIEPQGFLNPHPLVPSYINCVWPGPPSAPSQTQGGSVEGFFIDSLYINDGYCDCPSCEDEEGFTCDTCGACPVICQESKLERGLAILQNANIWAKVKIRNSINLINPSEPVSLPVRCDRCVAVGVPARITFHVTSATRLS